MHQKNCICKTLWYDSRIYLFCFNILLLFLLFLTFTKPVLLSRFKCKFLIVPYSANRSARDSSSASWWTPRTITIHPSIAYKIKYKRYREKESTLLLTIYTLDLFLISFLYKYYIHKTEQKEDTYIVQEEHHWCYLLWNRVMHENLWISGIFILIS